MSTVDWIVNKNRKPTENTKYLSVVHGGIEYRFTQHQVKDARERALKQPEDNFDVAEHIT